MKCFNPLFRITVLLLIVIHVVCTNSNAQTSVLIPEKLQTEYLNNPLGIDALTPRLSWSLKSKDQSAFGKAQAEYQILVSSASDLLKANKGDVWNSGWIKSSAMHLVNYKGKPLVSDKSYFWKVRVKDEKHRLSGWSKPAMWTTGLLRQGDWQAKWIGTDQIFNPASADCNIIDPWLRKTFNIQTKPSKAIFFVASIGFHELYVNGQKVTDDVLSPAVTDHTKRARYVAYDIAPLLQSGKNVIALWLGTSWSIFGPYIQKDRPNTPIVIAQGKIGATIIKTDETWKTHYSPSKLLGVWDSNRMGGELYDATKENSAWNTLACDERSWKDAIVYQPKLKLSAHQIEPSRLFNQINPISVTENKDGSYRVDMGVNFAGFTAVNVTGNPGDQIDFLYSEREQEVVTFGLHSAYIIGKTGKGTFKNRFNYSSGRWITIKGLKSKPRLSDIKGWMIRTNFETATTFECSDPLQNWIYNTVNWTFQNLALGGYVVDCPQRERLGYGGDAHSTCETAMFNYKMGAFYTKWMEDWRDVQGTESIVGNMYDASWAHKGVMSGRPLHEGIVPHAAPTYMGGGGPPWGGIVVSLPWFFYQHEGDTQILSKNFDMIKKWLAFLDTQTKDDMLVRFGGDWDFLGDWLWPGATAEGMNNNKPQTLFFNNCYRIFNLKTAIKIARVLGKTQDAARWEKQAAVSGAAVHAKYYNQDDHSYSDQSMSNLAAALLSDIMPANLRPAVMARLEKEILKVRNGHINVGITGGAMLFKVLRDAGRDDLIYSMTSKNTYPSWGYMKENDATTIWEMWEKDLPGHSLLHSSYLYPGAWYIEGVAGIKRDPDHPGMQQFILRPPKLTENQMSWAKATMQASSGLIKTYWKRENDKLYYEITVPPNCIATLEIPLHEAGRMTGNTANLKSLSDRNGFKRFELNSGNYKLTLLQTS